jgi:hypothetical protein
MHRSFGTLAAGVVLVGLDVVRGRLLHRGRDGFRSFDIHDPKAICLVWTAAPSVPPTLTGAGISGPMVAWARRRRTVIDLRKDKEP